MVGTEWVTTRTARGRATAVVGALVAALLAIGVVQAPPAQAAAPVAAKVAPAFAAVGTGVTVAGADLNGTTAVRFMGSGGAGVNAPHFVVLDPKKLVVQVPPGAETGPIRVTTPDGQSTTPGNVVILEPPVIDTLSASVGAPGEELTIAGSNLMGAKKPKVLFGAKGASPVSMTQSELKVKVPAGVPGGPVTIEVQTTGGAAKANFYIAPFIKGIAPPAGTTAGGTVVTIVGSGFTGVDNFVDNPGTPAVNEKFDGVRIGGVRVTKLIRVSDLEVVAQVPAGIDPAADVVVRTTHDGTVAASATAPTFAYQPLPAVTAVSQNWNEVNAPSEVTVTGVNFTSSTVVKVGSLQATDAVVDEVAGTITFTPPASPKPAVTAISFTNTANGVPYTTTTPFAYIAAPVVAKLAPVTGQAGAAVIVSGANFASGTTVKFGNTAASCSVVSFVALRCIAPAGSGAVDVTVTNGVGSSATTAASTFTYLAGTAAAPPAVGAPVVAALTPSYGAPGTTVAFKGANLQNVTKIQFTGAEDTWVNAPNYLVVGPGRLVVTVPSGAVTGELRLTHPNGVVRTEGKVFVATKKPSVSSIDVVGDMTFGVTPGDMLKIRGSGLWLKGAKTLVTIGGKPAPVLTKPAPKAGTIVVRVPANVGGRQPVVVTTPLGSGESEVQVFYIPEVKGAKPATYSRAGGTVVTIAGTGFTGADDVTIGDGRRSAVTFGGISVARMVVMNDKLLVVTTAPGSASADDLVVTTEHDGRYGNSDGKTRSINAPIPRITGISPDNGPTGSTPPAVTITGENLTVNSVVRFGASTATVQSAAPDGTSAVVVPPVRGTATTVSVTVINNDDGDELTTIAPNAYTYVLQPATITGMSASTAKAGTSVTLSGTSFVDVTSVKFGDVSAPFTVQNDNTIFTTVPATPSGAGGTGTHVTVVNGTGVVSATSPASAWGWDNSPMITAVSPSTAAMGSTITISGSGFTGVTNVRIGWNNVLYTVVNENTITATVPATPVGLGGVTVDVVVEIGAYTSLAANPSADNFTWASPAVITGMSHNTAPAGTTVTVTGTGFTNVSAVTIHNMSLTYTVISPTQLTFVAPAGTSGPTSPGSTRDVRVTNGSGQQSTANPAGAAAWTFQ